MFYKDEKQSGIFSGLVSRYGPQYKGLVVMELLQLFHHFSFFMWYALRPKAYFVFGREGIHMGVLYCVGRDGGNPHGYSIMLGWGAPMNTPLYFSLSL